MKTAVIIPAAGEGKRFNSMQVGHKAGSKIELDLHGRPVFLRAAELFLKRPEVATVLIAVNPDTIDEFKFRWADKLGFMGIQVVPGGKAERWETVLNAMKHLDDSFTHIAVHDAVRPLASKELVDRIFAAADRYAAVVPGLPVSNTLKRVKPDQTSEKHDDPLDAILGGSDVGLKLAGRVTETIAREQLFEVQTPQVFEINLLRRAYKQISANNLQAGDVTDDAYLVEKLGEPVWIVEGESTNIKITRPEDAEIAQAIVAKRDESQAKELATKRLFGDDDE